MEVITRQKLQHEAKATANKLRMKIYLKSWKEIQPFCIQRWLFCFEGFVDFFEVRFSQITKDHLSHLPVKGQPSSEAWLFIFNPRGTWDIVHPLKILSRWSKPSNVDMAKWWPQGKHDWSPQTEGVFTIRSCVFSAFSKESNLWKGQGCRKAEEKPWLTAPTNFFEFDGKFQHVCFSCPIGRQSTMVSWSWLWLIASLHLKMS